MKRYNRYIILALFFLCSCSDNVKISTDDFYTRGGGLDYVRIPFIKPYEALLLNGNLEWEMNLKYEMAASSVSNIKKVNIVQNLILLYSNNTYLNGNKVKEAWFVIIPHQHIEKGFIDHIDYVKYLNGRGILKEPKLYSVSDIRDYFDSHHLINWEALK